MSLRADRARGVAVALDALADTMCSSRFRRILGTCWPSRAGLVPAARRAVESALAAYGAAVHGDEVATREAAVMHAAVCVEHDHGVDELREWAQALRRRADGWEREARATC